jgi:hypothetical protein
MSLCSRSSRVALWAAVCALVLKAAVPMLAAGAAQMRGVPVAEVCTVYGVALPSASQAGHAHHPHHHHGAQADHEDHSKHSATAHSGDHCALTVLAALAVPDIVPPTVAPGHAVAAVRVADRSVVFRDASAAWAARLQHGPPSLA